MARMIYYKTKQRTFHTETGVALQIQSQDHNEMIGGKGALGEAGIQLVKRKLARKHCCTEEQIILCNIFDV
jgi:hypothetical protein